MVPAGNPAICQVIDPQTGGFASPPRSGFALELVASYTRGALKNNVSKWRHVEVSAQCDAQWLHAAAARGDRLANCGREPLWSTKCWKIRQMRARARSATWRAMADGRRRARFTVCEFAKGFPYAASESLIRVFASMARRFSGSVRMFKGRDACSSP
jgi:hypothetical protein